MLAPEHPLVPELLAGHPDQAELEAWVQAMRDQRAVRQADPDLEKEGFDTGHGIVNPITGERVPLWVANYVLMEYGTGAVMAVPASGEAQEA